MVAGAAAQKLAANLDKEQEVLMNIADMLIDVYTSETALLRTQKLTETYGEITASFQADIMHTYIYDAATRINKNGKDALNAFAEADELRMMHMGLKRFTNS